jgi:UDP-sugar transporter A1/2/3
MLSRQLSRKQWISLVLLMVGVTLVQWPTTSTEPVPSNDDSSSQVISAQEGLMGSKSHFIGLMAVLMSCFSSGFSGVYFEKLVKFSQQSLWIRNLQLCLFASVFSLLAIVLQDGKAILEHGFFQGYDAITWSIVLVQAFGGLLVSFVMKYADNILKGFATSVSIVVSTIVSYFILEDFVPSHLFVFGSMIVISATFLYSS